MKAKENVKSRQLRIVLKNSDRKLTYQDGKSYITLENVIRRVFECLQNEHEYLFHARRMFSWCQVMFFVIQTD